jgi:hypothetical protein
MARHDKVKAEGREHQGAHESAEQLLLTTLHTCCFFLKKKLKRAKPQGPHRKIPRGQTRDQIGAISAAVRGLINRRSISLALHWD